MLHRAQMFQNEDKDDKPLVQLCKMPSKGLDVADDLFFLKAPLREAPLTSNHSGYGSNTTNQVEDRN